MAHLPLVMPSHWYFKTPSRQPHVGPKLTVLLFPFRVNVLLLGTCGELLVPFGFSSTHCAICGGGFRSCGPHGFPWKCWGTFSCSMTLFFCRICTDSSYFLGSLWSLWLGGWVTHCNRRALWRDCVNPWVPADLGGWGPKCWLSP